MIAPAAALAGVLSCAPDPSFPRNSARAPQADATPAVRPAPPGASNFVLITIDTLRADHLSCYGYGRSTTPRIDELAQRGIVFEQAAAQWPKTGPSMASLMTSTYGSTSGVMRTTMDQRVPLAYDLLAERMRLNGYETLGVVANMSLSPAFQFDQGFDRYYVNDKLNGDAITDAARKMVETRAGGRPYFLWVHYLDPHAPYRPPRGFGDEFLSDALFQSDERPLVAIDPRVADPKAPQPEMSDVGMIPAYAHIKGSTHLRDYVARYDGDVRFVDEQVGLLLDGLRALGELDHAVVVVTADHGESLGDHNYFFEHGRFPYDDCVRVPLIIAHPEWQPGRVQAQVGLIDVAPTLLEIAGIEPGWQFEGQSLVGWIREGAPAEKARPVFTESGYGQQFEISIRKGRWKLIRVGTRYMAGLLQKQPYELYDVFADPGETKNLVDAEPDVFDDLRAELDKYRDVAYARVPPPQDGPPVVPDEAMQNTINELGYGDDKSRVKQGEHDTNGRDGGGD